MSCLSCHCFSGCSLWRLSSLSPPGELPGRRCLMRCRGHREPVTYGKIRMDTHRRQMAGWMCNWCSLLHCRVEEGQVYQGDEPLGYPETLQGQVQHKLCLTQGSALVLDPLAMHLPMSWKQNQPLRGQFDNQTWEHLFPFPSSSSSAKIKPSWILIISDGHAYSATQGYT